jgi:hypothetical protein
MKNQKIRITFKSLLLFSMALCTSAFADTVWKGTTSSDWSVAANWDGGVLPSTPGSGNAVINPGSPFLSPVVSNPGNTTIGQLYLSIGVGLSVVTGGQLSVASDLVTGVWGNSLTLSVSGGALNMGNYLNMGAGGFDGDVSISGGQITAGMLSINTLGGATMDISGSGSFVAPSGPNLGNINYWVTHNAITANGGAPGSFINIDTATLPGSLILTAVPEASTMALFGLGVAFLGLIKRRG